MVYYVLDGLVWYSTGMTTAGTGTGDRVWTKDELCRLWKAFYVLTPECREVGIGPTRRARGPGAQGGAQGGMRVAVASEPAVSHLASLFSALMGLDTWKRGH